MTTLQNDNFFSFSVLRHPFIKLFHLSNLLQMPNDHRMLDVEFFGNFCSYKISFFFFNMKCFMNLCVILAQGPCSSLYRSNFSICAAKASTRISFDGCSRLVVVNFWWPATMLLISIISSPLHNFLNHHCTVHLLAACWAKCIVDVVSYLCCFTTHFKLKKIAWICFLSNIISIV